MKPLDFPALHPKVVLGVAAHPDDLDFGAGGTMAAFARAGAAVYYLVLTDGGKGSADRHMTSPALTQTRRQEQRVAGAILGLKDVFFLDYPDGALENTLEVKRDIARYIRRLKPDVVVTLDPSKLYDAGQGLINHPDHRAAGQAALDAVYPLARDHMTFPELLADGLEPHNVATVLLINWLDGNYTADITDTLELKLRALAAHASQFGDIAGVQARARDWAEQAGAAHGHQYGEPFIRIDVH